MKNARVTLERRVAELEDALAGSMRQNQEQEAEIARLKQEAEHREQLIGAWVGVLGSVKQRLTNALTSGEIFAEVRRIIRDIEAQLTL